MAATSPMLSGVPASLFARFSFISSVGLSEFTGGTSGSIREKQKAQLRRAARVSIVPSTCRPVVLLEKAVCNRVANLPRGLSVAHEKGLGEKLPRRACSETELVISRNAQ